MSLDVPHVGRPMPMLGDDPEDVAVEPIGNRSPPPPARPSADRLEDGGPWGWKAQAEERTDRRVDDVAREGGCDPPLVHTSRPREAMVVLREGEFACQA